MTRIGRESGGGETSDSVCNQDIAQASAGRVPITPAIASTTRLQFFAAAFNWARPVAVSR
jgi:hypothetical protein